MPVRIGGVLLAALLIVPALAGVTLAASGSTLGGILATVGFLVFFGGIIGVLIAVRRKNDVQRQHDRQWGPRPRSP